MPLDGFVIDIRRGDLLIEIQTASFGAMGCKFDRLLGDYRMLLVHPIAVETYLEKPGRKARKSPKRGSIHSIFEELVSIPTLLDHPNLTLDVVLVAVTKSQEPTRRSRSGFRTVDRRLREVLGIHRFRDTDDLAELLPDKLPAPFTTADIATRAGIPRPLAQQMAFCLRALGVVTPVKRTKSGIHYERS